MVIRISHEESVSFSVHLAGQRVVGSPLWPMIFLATSDDPMMVRGIVGFFFYHVYHLIQ